jgi:hypothetical protein
LIITACSSPIAGGQTGDGSGVLPEPEPDQVIDTQVAPPCEYDREPVDDADDSAVGVSATEVLGFAEDTFDTDILWPEDPYAAAEYGPETSGGVQVEIRRGNGSAELLVPGGDAGVGVGCPPTLSVPVDVTVETEGGALREAFSAELLAISPELATFAVRIAADDLGGTLELENAPEGSELRSVTISGFVSPHGAAGSLEVHSGAGSEDEVVVQAAHWPAQGCGGELFQQPEIVLPAGAEVEGRTYAALRDALVTASPIPLQWSDGAESELTITPGRDSRACLSNQGGAPRLRAAADLELASADGRLAGTLPGTLTDIAPPGDALWLHVDANTELDAAEFAGRITLEGFEPGDFERVQTSLYLDVGESVTGGIAVVGIDACQGEAPEPVMSCEYSPVLDAGLGEFRITKDEPIVP